MKTEMREV